MCLRERTVNGKTTEETHYFIGSGRLGARKAAKALRGHWGIENNLHWQLDVHFGEDRSRIQERNAARKGASVNKLDKLAAYWVSFYSCTTAVRRNGFSRNTIGVLVSVNFQCYN